MKYNKGFAPLVLIAIIVGALAIGGGSYYLGTKKNTEKEKIENSIIDENQNEIDLNSKTADIKESTLDKNLLIYANSDFTFSYQKNRFLEKFNFDGKEGVFVKDCTGTDEKCITNLLLFSIYTKNDIKTIENLKVFLEDQISKYNMSYSCGIKPSWSNNYKINGLETIQVNRSVCVGGGSGERYPVPIIGTIYNNKAYIIDFTIGEYTGSEKNEFDNLVSSFSFINSEGSTTKDVIDQPAYLKSVYTKNGKNYISVDYIQMFKTSEERIKAMIEDGECTYIGNNDCYDFPNGYKRNANPLIRTFEVDSNVTINVYGEYNQYLNNGVHDSRSSITFEQLKVFYNKHPEIYEQYISIDVKNNKVTKIVEPYQE